MRVVLEHRREYEFQWVAIRNKRTPGKPLMNWFDRYIGPIAVPHAGSET